MTRWVIDNLFLIWLVLGLGFWLTWVIWAPAYDSGVMAGIVFGGAYSLGLPYLLGTALLHALVGPQLTVLQHLLAVALGAIPLIFTHRRYKSLRLASEM